MDTSYQNWWKTIHSWSQKLLFTFKNVICVMFISQKTRHSTFSFLVNAIFLASSIQHFSLTVSSRVLSRFMMCLLVSSDFGSWTHAIQTCITYQGLQIRKVARYIVTSGQGSYHDTSSFKKKLVNGPEIHPRILLMSEKKDSVEFVQT